MNACRNCLYYTDGVPDSLRHEWSGTNLGRYATGICNKYFPKGYLGRKPPHPAMQNGSCFQYEPKTEIEGQEAIE